MILKSLPGPRSLSGSSSSIARSSPWCQLSPGCWARGGQQSRPALGVGGQNLTAGVFPNASSPTATDSLGKAWGLLKCRFLGPVLGPSENLRGWDLGNPPFKCLHMVLRTLTYKVLSLRMVTLGTGLCLLHGFPSLIHPQTKADTKAE